MSIGNLFHRADGYYDENGQWQRTKFCFVSCGDRCTCRAPGGQYYSIEHDKRLIKTDQPDDGLLRGSSSEAR